MLHLGKPICVISSATYAYYEISQYINLNKFSIYFCSDHDFCYSGKLQVQKLLKIQNSEL